MWRNIAKQLSSKNPAKVSLNPQYFSRTCSFLWFSQDSNFPGKFQFFRPFELNSVCNGTFPELGPCRIGEFLPRDEFLGRPSLSCVRHQVSVNGLCGKNYVSVAEAMAVSSTDAEDDVFSVHQVNDKILCPNNYASVTEAGAVSSTYGEDEATVTNEVQELLQEMGKERKRQVGFRRRRQQRMDRGVGHGKYQMLRRRQVKIETEAWENAAKEYKELLKDMCEQKLAPNLPYMKSLFLGWFEPLMNKIVAEQELYKQGKNRAAYAPYFDQLPADMMAVITMHKLMGMMMMGGGHGSARVVQAACSIGDAIEQEQR